MKKAQSYILATSVDASDDALEKLCLQHGIEVYRGALSDVLDRYYQCAKKYGADHIVRITGDCPLFDWEVADAVVRKHLDEGNDYTSNTIDPTYPDGLDVEVMRFSALETAWKKACLPSEREHVTQYFYNHSEEFQMANFSAEKDFSNLRWTVDLPQDLEFIQKIYEEIGNDAAKKDFGKNSFTMKDILFFLENHSEKLAINQGLKRNDGLLKSKMEDAVFLNEKEGQNGNQKS